MILTRGDVCASVCSEGPRRAALWRVTAGLATAPAGRSEGPPIAFLRVVPWMQMLPGDLFSLDDFKQPRLERREICLWFADLEHLV